MLCRSSFAAGVFALLQISSAASASVSTLSPPPPECVQKTIDLYSDPQWVMWICQGTDLKSEAAMYCDEMGDVETAYGALIDMCNAVGVKIVRDNPTPTSSSPSSLAPPAIRPRITSTLPERISLLSAPMLSGLDLLGSTGGFLTPSGYDPYTASSATGIMIATGFPRLSSSPTVMKGPAQTSNAAVRLDVGVAAVVAGLAVVF